MKSANRNGSHTETNTGWFKACRFPDMPDFVERCRTAFVLAYALAFRARWNERAFNPYNLATGEAVCDYPNWGLSEQEFRNARNKLQEWGFATFRTTNKGTIGKLVDSRLFSVLPAVSNERDNEQVANGATNKKRAGQRHTKSKELKSKEHKGRKGRLAATRSSEANEAECWNIGCELGLDSDFIEQFIQQHQRDGWTAPVKRTGQIKPIGNLKAALQAFCEKLETDRSGY